MASSRSGSASGNEPVASSCPKAGAALLLVERGELDLPRSERREELLLGAHTLLGLESKPPE